MANPTILKSKLIIPPLRDNFIPRLDLVSKLREGFSRKLILVTAPAGYGKTTLLAEWASEAEIPVTWLSLDGSENDLPGFLIHLISSIQVHFESLGDTILMALNASTPIKTGYLLNELMNEISEISHPFAIVIDNFHRINNQQVIKALGFIIEHQPPQLRVAISSRLDIPLSFARSRAHGDAIEFEREDLRFTLDETRSFFFNRFGDLVSEEFISKVDKMIGGWVAGLQILAHSMADETDIESYMANFSGKDSFIIDYLIEEVFLLQTEAEQEFLLKTSFLDYLTAPLCNHVLGIKNSQEYLDRFVKNGIVIAPLENSNDWYQYDPLFVTALKSKLENLYPDEIIPLYRRAAAWFKNSGDCQNMVKYTLLSGDEAQVSQFLIDNFASLWACEETQLLLQLYRMIPLSEFQTNAELCLDYARVSWVAGDFISVQNNLDIVASILRVTPQNEKTSRLQSLFRVIKLGQEITKGNLEIAIHEGKNTLEQLRPEDDDWRVVLLIQLARIYQSRCDFAEAEKLLLEAQSLCIKHQYQFPLITTYYFLSCSKMTQGKYKDAYNTCLQVLNSFNAETDNKPTNLARIYIIMAKILLEQYELEESQNWLENAIRLTQQVGNYWALLDAKIFETELKISVRDIKGAQIALHQAKKLIASIDHKHLLEKISGLEIILRLYRGEFETVKQWVEKKYENLLSAYQPNLHIQYIILVKYFLADNQYDQAVKLIDLMLMSSRKLKLLQVQTESLALRAVTLFLSGDQASAAEDLLQALELAQHQGSLLCFLDLGEPMYKCLLELRSKIKIPINFYEQVLGAFENFYGLQALPVQSVYTPLTNRELEVLSLMNQGLSNKEIAAKLVISYNTIKNHAKSIYKKLNVSGRKHALNQAKALGIFNNQ